MHKNMLERTFTFKITKTILFKDSIDMVLPVRRINGIVKISHLENTRLGESVFMNNV